MYRAGRAFCVIGALSAWSAVAAQHSQHPLGSKGMSSVGAEGIEVGQDGWDFGAAPPANSTAQLVFSTVQNLLQHWSNTRYRNGHNIVPGVVPVGTLLYHGTYQNALPSAPDWVATDPEHSYLFCDSRQDDEGCWHATLIAARPLKVLYFDGSSAAKMLGGPMDSQDVVAWGKVRPEKTFSEKERITDLCHWGKEVGLDGFVRMEMDFEIMLCDFTSGVEIVSILNLRSTSEMRRPPPRREGPPNLVHIGVVEAGSWHNRVPGETRIHLDYSRLISFYDSSLFPSLVAAREGRARLEHRLENLSQDDTQTFKERLEQAVKGDWAGVGSGVDWKSLLSTVTERFAERIELLAYILNTTDTEIGSVAPSKRAFQAHRYLTGMLQFYTLNSAVPPNVTTKATSAAGSDHAWAAPILAQCATTHTRWLEKTPITTKLSDSERLLLRSVNGVQKEICRVLVGIWAEGAELGMLPEEPEDDDELATAALTKGLTQDWLARMEKLMGWLDWSSWLRCRPACGYEEMCYLPTWPYFGFPGRRGPRPESSRFMDRIHNEMISRDAEDLLDDEEWKDPQPRCIRRVEPFSLRQR